MARDEAPPFARGETYFNDPTAAANAPNDPLGLGGINLEGKEFVFEPDSPAAESSNPALGNDPSGRLVRVKVVRNVSPVNLKPARIAHFQAASTAGLVYETRIDGYCFAAGDRPAGVIDEYLPAAGVPPNDLFYVVIDGPTSVTNQTAAPVTTAIGSRIVPAVTGATAGDDLAGRVALQDLTGATSVLGNAIQNKIGYAASINSTTSGVFNAVAHLRY
jgi:hypothetical protein